MSLSVDFERLYAEHVNALVGQVYVLTGDLGAAQDAVQEAWVRAWMRWDKVGAYEQPVAWVRRVAMNVAVSRWRRTRRVVFGAELPDREGPVPDVDDRLDLADALRDLSLQARQVIVLHHLVGLPVEDVAGELGIAVGTVKSRLARARDRLATDLLPPVPALVPEESLRRA